MKGVAYSVSVVLFAAGVVLLAWVAYDATAVLNAFGPRVTVDEASVAVLTFTGGLGLVVSGVMSCSQRGQIYFFSVINK